MLNTEGVGQKVNIVKTETAVVSLGFEKKKKGRRSVGSSEKTAGKADLKVGETSNTDFNLVYLMKVLFESSQPNSHRSLSHRPHHSPRSLIPPPSISILRKHPASTLPSSLGACILKLPISQDIVPQLPLSSLQQLNLYHSSILSARGLGSLSLHLSKHIASSRDLCIYQPFDPRSRGS
jgi:hypothetical protein